MRRLLLVTAALAVLAATTAPASAGGAVSLTGTYDGADFSEVCGPPLPTLGVPGCLVVIQIDTNLGPVTQTVELPFSDFVFHANSALQFEGPGTWDFGGGNVLLTHLTGVLGFSGGVTQLHEEVIGGEGTYSGATGTIHSSDFGSGPDQSAFSSNGGFVKGVIK